MPWWVYSLFFVSLFLFTVFVFCFIISSISYCFQPDHPDERQDSENINNIPRSRHQIYNESYFVTCNSWLKGCSKVRFVLAGRSAWLKTKQQLYKWISGTEKMKQKKDTRVGHKKHEKNENKWGPNKKMKKKKTKNHEDPPKKWPKHTHNEKKMRSQKSMTKNEK